MIVGITGGIGSGKSTVCKIFHSLGVPIISADEISHSLLDNDTEILKAIVEKFGTDILSKQHNIDRQKLQNIIFKSSFDKQWLEKLLHPIIKNEIAERTKVCNYPYCIVEIPLLIEAEMEDSVDRILAIDCSEALQFERTLKRDKRSKDIISAIIANQITRKERLSKCDDIIDNSADIDALEQIVRQQHKYYLSMAKHNKH